jgi:hypothetical protein
VLLEVYAVKLLPFGTGLGVPGRRLMERPGESIEDIAASLRDAAVIADRDAEETDGSNVDRTTSPATSSAQYLA